MPGPDATPHPIAEFRVDALRVVVHQDRRALGRAAAELVAGVIARRQAEAGRANVIFAAAPSQDEFLDALATPGQVDWSRVLAFHMDEYFGIDADHPASFRGYLRRHLFDRVGLSYDRLRLIPGEDIMTPLATCLTYESLLNASPPDVVCAGIGENGHLAFNDPPVADFLDPLKIKPVRLDYACRLQQVHDGCFASIEDVPTHAYTLTIPALLSAPVISLCVPGPRKAEAVRATLRDPISEACPATALRRREGAVLHLDPESAAHVI
jgi:glucosamine-6-phosphate deaminase